MRRALALLQYLEVAAAERRGGAPPERPVWVCAEETRGGLAPAAPAGKSPGAPATGKRAHPLSPLVQAHRRLCVVGVLLQVPEIVAPAGQKPSATLHLA